MGAGQWDDPLVNTVWHQIHQREGEDQSARIERERAEAAAAAKRRRVQAERSRELAKARGVRSGQFDRTLLRRLMAATGVLALLVLLAAGYYLDDQRRRRALDTPATPGSAVRVLGRHPLAPHRRRGATPLRAAARDGLGRSAYCRVAPGHRVVPEALLR